MADEEGTIEVTTEGTTEAQQERTNKKEKKEKKNNADSRISALTSFFYDECFSLKGFKPSLDGGDGSAIKRVLKVMTEDEIRRAIAFYLKSPKAKDCGVTLKAALSTHSLNSWKEQKEKTNWQVIQ
jgi:hypothetical protein